MQYSNMIKTKLDLKHFWPQVLQVVPITIFEQPPVSDPLESFQSSYESSTGPISLFHYLQYRHNRLHIILQNMVYCSHERIKSVFYQYADKA